MQSTSPRRFVTLTVMVLGTLASNVTPALAQSPASDCGYNYGYNSGYSNGYDSGYSRGYTDGRYARPRCPQAYWVPGRVSEGHYGGRVYGEQVQRYVVPDVPASDLPGNSRIGFGMPAWCPPGPGLVPWYCDRSPSAYSWSPYSPY